MNLNLKPNSLNLAWVKPESIERVPLVSQSKSVRCPLCLLSKSSQCQMEEHLQLEILATFLAKIWTTALVSWLKMTLKFNTQLLPKQEISNKTLLNWTKIWLKLSEKWRTQKSLPLLRIRMKQLFCKTNWSNHIQGNRFMNNWTQLRM